MEAPDRNCIYSSFFFFPRRGRPHMSREEWARSDQGKKVANGGCGHGIEVERRDDGLRLDMPNRGRTGRVRPTEGI